MSGAETLRRAAALMRERAEAASPGPWSCDGKSGIDDLHFGHVGLPVLRGPHGPNSYGPSLADTQHMAGMDPPVALALAAWLEYEAERFFNAYDASPSVRYIAITPREHNLAMDIANAYLGEDA